MQNYLVIEVKEVTISIIFFPHKDIQISLIACTLLLKLGPQWGKTYVVVFAKGILCTTEIPET